METSYVYGFALFSTILLVLIPYTLIGFGYSAPQNDLPIIVRAINGLLSFVLNLINWSIQAGVIIIKYLTLGVLYIANGLTLGFSTAVDAAIDAVDAFFDVSFTNVDMFFQEIITYITDLIAIYSYIPTPIMLILLVPWMLAVAISLIPVTS